MPPSDQTVADVPPPARLQRRDLRRLPGRPSLLTPVSFYRLWLAGDFLLQLERTGYTQILQRFAYRDVQALEICRTPRAAVYNVILGLLTLLCLLLAWLADTKSLAAAGCLLALLVINVVRGPTCACVLQTALGPRVLPSLSRERTARRAVALIAERVEAAQRGGMTDDE